MLSSVEFEYDLAAHRVYEFKKSLWMYEEEDEEYEDYRQLVRWLNQIRDRRKTLARIAMDIGQYRKDTPERKKMQADYDQIKGELLVRCAKISYRWEQTVGAGFEERERERLGLKRKYS